MESPRVIDLEYSGRKEVIASLLLEGRNGIALIDPGPSSTLPTLRAKLADLGISTEEITTLLLTHIHLDHAGATGSLLRENPGIEVHVHEKGAPHLADPSRLLASAKRLYGDRMEQMWGKFLPVPAANLRVLTGGEILRVGGRTLEVLYTPGHASHHVSYFDPLDGTAYAGDTAGLRLGNRPLVLPVTPPPDIDLELWEGSLQQIELRAPERLFLTHFGFADRVGWHFAELRRRLGNWAEEALDISRNQQDDPARMAAFTGAVRAEFRQQLPPDECDLYERAGNLNLNWLGLARYWKKKNTPA